VLLRANLNDAKVQAISANADRYADSMLSGDSFMQHLDTLLLQYATLVRFPVHVDPLLDIPVDVVLNNSFQKRMAYLEVASKVLS
jgi:hypothetical protein